MDKVVEQDETHGVAAEKKKKKNSEKFENQVITMLKNIIKILKIDKNYFKTENEIKMLEKYTPDILFNKPIFINNKMVKWIEIKNFYINSQDKFIFKKVTKQITNYVNEFNTNQMTGVVISKGFDNNVNKMGVLFIDGYNIINSHCTNNKRTNQINDFLPESKKRKLN